MSTLLLTALAAAPRRYRMPDLPADLGSVRAEDAHTQLAFAIEAARRAQAGGPPVHSATAALFTSALAALIADALEEGAGDPAFQAQALQARDAYVREHLRLAAQATADVRAVRAVTDALAHPGKLRNLPHDTTRDALANLHRAAEEADWPSVRTSLQRFATASASVDAALARLERSAQLRSLAPVQRYLALNALQGPSAGSPEATALGRSAAQRGDDAEAETARAFEAIAQLLNAQGDTPTRYRVARSLRTPRGFPAPTEKAKEEWDAALLQTGDPAADIALLAEVKASPAAATGDYTRLLRGLDRLAHASASASYAFASADGEVLLAGASLRALQPQGQQPPPHVFYCCTAADEARPPLLSAASKSALLAEPPSLAYAQRLAQGAPPAQEDLLPAWAALATEPRLRSTLNQYETARLSREAMLHPADLLAAVTEALGRGWRACG